VRYASNHGPHSLDQEPPADGFTAPALRPCFGIACSVHYRCARYAAVDRSEADARTMGTCRQGDIFPMFVQLGINGRG
jgi:hypothetical protein